LIDRSILVDLLDSLKVALNGYFLTHLHKVKCHAFRRILGAKVGAIVMKRFNDWLGNKLAIFLSTMGCFYLIFALVIVPLFFQHPTDLVGWVKYIVESIFQGVALPILGYVAMKSRQNQERVLNETHGIVMAELALVNEELQMAKDERASLQTLIEELHQHYIRNRVHS
jgi:hypothetical protein